MLKSLLTRPLCLWLSFAFAMLSYIGIVWVTLHWEMVHLDSQILPEHAYNTLKLYSPGHREVHIWSTATLDVLFPLTYSACFAGAIWKGLPFRFHALAWFALAALCFDLSEGAVQIALLTKPLSALEPPETEILFLAKSVLTSLKFITFLIAALSALAAAILMLKRRFGS